MVWSGWQTDRQTERWSDERDKMRQNREREYFFYLWILPQESFILWLHGDVKEEVTGGSYWQKACIMCHFPISLNLLRLHLNPTEALSLLQQPHLMQPTKEYDCTPMPALALHCHRPPHCWSLQRTEDTVWHHTWGCNVTLEKILSGVTLLDNYWTFGYKRKLQRRFYYNIKMFCFYNEHRHSRNSITDLN